MNRSKPSQRIARRKGQFGQGMTEYIIIVALVAIGAIGVYSAFGRTVQSQVAAVSEGLAGSNKAQQEVKAAGTEAGTAATDAGQTLGLDNYANNVKDQ